MERKPDSDDVRHESGGVAKDAGRRAPAVPHRPAGPSGVQGAGAPGTSVGVIALQRSAGNAAVAALLHAPEPGGQVAVQRCGPAHPDCGCSPEERRAAETADETESAPQPVQREVPGGGGGVEVHLRSARFTPSAKLELCFQDRARLRRGDPDTDAVQRVQEALLALPAKTGRTYDLGEKGADGVYGAKTAAAVVKFKSDEALGSTQFDDVGPGTMRRLDELFASGDGPLPPCPVPIPITTSFADGPGGAKAKVGALPIPGVNCQVVRPPVPPAGATPTDFATIPDAERRKIRSAADSKVPVEFDKRYSPLDRSGSPFQDAHVGTMVFAAGITDQAVKDGLSRVAGTLHTSTPPVLGKSRTLEMLVRDGFDKTTHPGHGDSGRHLPVHPLHPRHRRHDAGGADRRRSPCARPGPEQGGGLRRAARQVQQPRLHRRPGEGGPAPGDRRRADPGDAGRSASCRSSSWTSAPVSPRPGRTGSGTRPFPPSTRSRSRGCGAASS